MRTDAYVNRLMVATREENADAKKIARMVELTLGKVGSTPAGEEALRLVQKKMIKDALRRFSVPEDETERRGPGRPSKEVITSRKEAVVAPRKEEQTPVKAEAADISPFSYGDDEIDDVDTTPLMPVRSKPVDKHRRRRIYRIEI